MAFTPITGGGVFSSANIRDINSNFAAVNKPDLWVRPQYGDNGTATGTYDRPFASMAGAFGSRLLNPGMTIGLLGVTFEEATTPIVNDITIVGMGTKPRQATTSGAANGGGSTWLSPASGAANELLNIKGQGWTVQNVFFNNSTASKAAIILTVSGTGDPPADPDASHATIDSCWFTGAFCGVTSTGLPNFVTISNNVFFGFGDSGDKAIGYAVGGGVKTLYAWQIYGNEFWGNNRHIQAGFSGASIHDNHLSYVNNGVTTAIFYDATNGANNAVFNNTFDVDSGNGGIATMFVLGTNDRFSANRLSTAVTTTQFSWGDPA
jgi:hypothetical protein